MDCIRRDKEQSGSANVHGFGEIGLVEANDCTCEK